MGQYVFYLLLHQSTKTTTIYIHPNTWVPHVLVDTSFISLFAFASPPHYLSSTFSLVAPPYYHCAASSSIPLPLFSFWICSFLGLQIADLMRAKVDGGGGEPWPSSSISTQTKEQASIVNLGGDPPPRHQGMSQSSISTSLCYGSRQMKE